MLEVGILFVLFLYQRFKNKKLSFHFRFSTITFVYCVSKRFRTSGAAFFTVFCLLNFLGIITVLVVFTLNYSRRSGPVN